MKDKISDENLDALLSSKRSLIRKYEKQLKNQKQENLNKNQTQKLMFKFVKTKFTTSSTNRYLNKSRVSTNVSPEKLKSMNTTKNKENENEREISPESVVDGNIS